MPVLPPFLSFRARVARFSLMQINISYRVQPGAFICCGRATNTGEDDVTFGFDYRRFESQINGPDEKIQVGRMRSRFLCPSCYLRKTLIRSLVLSVVSFQK